MRSGVVDDWQRTTETLLSDVLRAAEEVERSNDGFARRNYVRAVFAAVEGITYGLKRVALAVWTQNQRKLSVDELELLVEVRFDNRVKTRKRFLPFCDAIKFAFEIFGKVHGFSPKLDYTASGWQALLEAAEVRHRLMHPKSSTELEVSEEELAKVRQGAEWFFPNRDQVVAMATMELKRSS